MGKIGFTIRIVAPYFLDMPPELKEKWLNQTKKSIPKTYQGLKKSIKTYKDFQKKIAKPVEENLTSFINPNYRSKHGVSYRQMLARAKDKLSRAGKRYFQRRKDIYETGKFEEKLEFGLTKYAKKWCRFIGPLKGYKAGGILGLSTLAVMSLTGDRRLADYLKEHNIRMEGEPKSVINPDKPNNFRRLFPNQIVHWGSEIIGGGYKETTINEANQEINRLVNEYLKAGFLPFQHQGNSHINFIITEIDNPIKPDEKIKQLGLDIQVAGE